MRKTLLSAIFVAALPFVNVSAAKADARSGTILDVWAMPNGTILFNHSGERPNLQPCQGPNVPKRWAIDGSTPAGQARVAALLTAYSLKQPIFIAGTASCPDWADTETVYWFATSAPSNGNGTVFLTPEATE